MKAFSLIGAAGYIAPRHMRAIKDTGNSLVSALDVHDTVGVLDSYFPEVKFFTEFERYDRYIDLMRRSGKSLDYIAITSPNYLHDSHARFALRVGANAICEKPLVINPWNIDGLRKLEVETGRRIYTVLQLRLHPSIIELKKKVEIATSQKAQKRFSVDLTYITSRGPWYFISWKGDGKKSGGIATNIGIHFFDMLLWVFGAARDSKLHLLKDDAASGVIEFEHADVKWFLSVNANYLPDDARGRGARTYRSILVDGEETEFSEGFTDLHTETYRDILSGGGFGLDDATPSISLVHAIRTSTVVGLAGEHHALARKAV